MITFEKVTFDNFREDDYLRANPDALHEVLTNIVPSALDHYKRNCVRTRFQYKTEVKNKELKVINNNCVDPNLLSYINESLDLEPLSDKLGKDYDNIFAPKGFLSEEKIGITSQFLEESQTYHEKYYQPAYYKDIIQLALGAVNRTYKNPLIFDMGSGSGNSVFAAIEVFTDCNIIASDLSPELLKILSKLKKEFYERSNVVSVAVDAQEAILKSDCFDLYIATGVLHHIIDIQQVFRIAYTALKNDGIMILNEPMLSGYMVLGSIYKTILQMNTTQDNKLNAIAEHVFTILAQEYKVRSKIYDRMFICEISGIDDKWIFSKSELIECAKEAGFAEIMFLNDKKSPRYRSEADYALRFFGTSFDDLPKWTQEMFANFDEYDIANDLNDIMFTSCIVCIK